jgi:hypothetical protein
MPLAFLYVSFFTHGRWIFCSYTFTWTFTTKTTEHTKTFTQESFHIIHIKDIYDRHQIYLTLSFGAKSSLVPHWFSFLQFLFQIMNFDRLVWTKLQFSTLSFCDFRNNFTKLLETFANNILNWKLCEITTYKFQCLWRYECFTIWTLDQRLLC